MIPETIAAIATPMGGGIGIIRISGEKAEAVARRIFRRGGVERTQARWSSHRLYYGHIIDCVSHQVIDEVLLALMRAPHSYTREDVVEIQCHGGAAVLARILEQVLASGVRMAEPGEFTRRAFINGRIDLSQAEAVADVINARSRMALEMAEVQLSGKFRQRVEFWTERLNSWLAELQAEIEFGDEIETASCRQGLHGKIENEILRPMDGLIRNFEQVHVVRDGVRISIAGRPNVGKSSLLNRLLKQERAIVTPLAGTTRDAIEQGCTIGGIPVQLVDTAGIRPSHDPIECMGVGKAREAIGTADLVLFVIDGRANMNDDDRHALAAVAGRKMILVINKIDLLDNRRFEMRVPAQTAAVVGVSALTGEGIRELEEVIARQCVETEKLSGPAVIPTVRQKTALETSQKFLQKACEGLRQGVSEELLVYDLSDAVSALQMITGEQADSDLLDQIFSRFCIGK